MIRKTLLALLALIVIFGATALVIFMLTGGGSTAQAPSTSSATPSVSEPAFQPPDGNPLQTYVQTPFTDRVLDFEEAYQMRELPNGFSRLTQFGTEQYLKDHMPPANGKYTLPGQDVIITVNRDLHKTIVVITGPNSDPNVKYVSVAAVISASRKAPDGTITPVDTDFQLDQIHATTWKLVDGVWRVDQER